MKAVGLVTTQLMTCTTTVPSFPIFDPLFLSRQFSNLQVRIVVIIVRKRHMLGLLHFPRVLLHVSRVDLDLSREERDGVDESQVVVTERAAYASSERAEWS